MADLSSSTRSIERLNNNNYDTWNIHIKYYLLGQDLWSFVGGAETTPPTDEEHKRLWKIGSGKTLYVLFVTAEHDFLQQIKDLTTLKEAWDTLKTLFMRKNDAKLQLLENELMSLRKGDMVDDQSYQCGRKGHFARDCLAKKVEVEESGSSEELDYGGQLQWNKGEEVVASCMDEPVEESTLVIVSGKD
ncbi:Zinc finger, CCHC-type [Sesbania bispinosa]|nr:Zinc finger, CCHC-type [Sesbania bispinosa]